MKCSNSDYVYRALEIMTLTLYNTFHSSSKNKESVNMDPPTECKVDSSNAQAETGAPRTPPSSTRITYPHVLLRSHRIWWPEVTISASMERQSSILTNKSRFSTKTRNRHYPPIIVCTLHQLSQVLWILRVVKIARQWDLAYLKKSDLPTSSQETAINVPCQYFDRVTRRLGHLSAFYDDDLDPSYKYNFRRFIENMVIRLRSGSKLEVRILVNGDSVSELKNGSIHPGNSEISLLKDDLRDGHGYCEIEHTVTMVKSQDKHCRFLHNFESALEGFDVKWETASDEEMRLIQA